MFMNFFVFLGPWGADRAALVLLMRTEKLKIRTPYERHYLLLCMAFSVLLKIRSACDDSFEPLTELERIRFFSTPKVLRLIELFHQFKPETPPSTAKKDDDTSTPTTDDVTEVPSPEIPTSEIPSPEISTSDVPSPGIPPSETPPSEMPSTSTKIIQSDTEKLEDTIEIVDNSDNIENKIDSPYNNCDIMSNAVVCDKNVLDKNVVVPQFEPRGSRNTRKGLYIQFSRIFSNIYICSSATFEPF